MLHLSQGTDFAGPAAIWQLASDMRRTTVVRIDSDLPKARGSFVIGDINILKSDARKKFLKRID